jgi:hypothetical protein
MAAQVESISSTLLSSRSSLPAAAAAAAVAAKKVGVPRLSSDIFLFSLDLVQR